jgi:hypothetical protein
MSFAIRQRKRKKAANLVGTKLAILKVDVALAHDVQQVDLRVHGKVNDPLAGHVGGDLLHEGRESLALRVGVETMLGLQSPSSIGAGLNGPHAVRVWGLGITLPGAISQTEQVASKMTEGKKDSNQKTYDRMYTPPSAGRR